MSKWKIFSSAIATKHEHYTQTNNKIRVLKAFVGLSHTRIIEILEDSLMALMVGSEKLLNLTKFENVKAVSMNFSPCMFISRHTNSNTFVSHRLR